LYIPGISAVSPPTSAVLHARQPSADAHRDEVDADAAMDAGLDGDLELGADAVGRGDQDRILEPGRAEVEQRPEAAQTGIGAAPAGRLGGWLDALDQSIARVDIDAGIAVGERFVAAGHVAGAGSEQ
jgi:hypothetical protein